MSVEASVPWRRLLAFIVVLSVSVGLGCLEAGLAQSKGQMSLTVDVSLAPTCFAPAETLRTGSPFAFLYPLHDALIEPFPENDIIPLAWRRSSGRRASVGCALISGAERA